MPLGTYRGIGLDTDPFGVLKSFQDEINRLFDGDSYGSVAAIASSTNPRINVWSDDDHVVVAAELPGINPDALEVSVLDNSITLRGKRSTLNAPGAEKRILKSERFAGEFSRTVDLPFTVNSAGVEAEYKAGILSVKLPRAEEEKPKRISVRTN